MFRWGCSGGGVVQVGVFKWGGRGSVRGEEQMGKRYGD